MKKKVLTFVLLLLLAGMAMIVGHEVRKYLDAGDAAESAETATVTDPVDRSLYYTYEDVETVVSYLSDTEEETEALSRLIDPLKKSDLINVRFIKSVAEAIGVKDMVYADVLIGMEDTDYVTKEAFETVYENIVAAAVVKGLLRQDLLVLDLSDEDDTVFFNGHEDYSAEFAIDESYEGRVIDVYMKNGSIFKINGYGSSEISLASCWVTETADGTCTFQYGDLQKIYPMRADITLPDDTAEAATTLDADRKADVGYETAGYEAQLVFDATGIAEIVKPEKILRGKVLSAGETDVQVENIGGLTLAEDYKVYNVYEDVTNEESTAILSGYPYVDFYFSNGAVEAIVIDQELKSEMIRVILDNDDYSSYEMQTVRLTATSDFTVTGPEEETEQSYAAGEVVEFVPEDYAEGDVITVTPEARGGRVKLLSLNRECGNPEYEGTIELDVKDEYIYIINELSLERYLANVVANAMPSDYPDAALCAMAICARGTAYAKMKDESYAEYNAHLDDSSLCQVYNNVVETEASVRAVKDTYGLVPTYHGTLIVPMTFNTSCGTTCTNADIWGGDAYPYLEANIETLEKDAVDLSEEADFITFMEDSSEYEIIDSASANYRWEISFTQEDMTEAVTDVLAEREQLLADSVLTENEAGEFVEAEIPDLGTIASVEVAERTASGVVSTLVIRGSNGAISISGQSNIRAILSPANQVIKRQDGSELTGWTSLPSPYYYVEKTDDGFVVKGGGFGHGAGMSIYGAGVLARRGKSYKYILRHYFSYVDFASIYDAEAEETDSE